MFEEFLLDLFLHVVRPLAVSEFRVAVVVQPGSGDVLQFLKSGIMEIPDVLVITKADLGQLATRTRRDIAAALRSLGSSATPVVAVSSLSPSSGSKACAKRFRCMCAGRARLLAIRRK